MKKKQEKKNTKLHINLRNSSTLARPILQRDSIDYISFSTLLSTLPKAHIFLYTCGSHARPRGWKIWDHSRSLIYRYKLQSIHISSLLTMVFLSCQFLLLIWLSKDLGPSSPAGWPRADLESKTPDLDRPAGLNGLGLKSSLRSKRRKAKLGLSTLPF